MSSDSATPPAPTPGPFCSLVDAQLSLLALGELEPEEAASANEHLADCTWCQQRLREYETVHAALHRTYAPLLPDATPAIPWEEIARLEAAIDDEDDHALDGAPATTHLPVHLWVPSSSRQIAASIGALAAAVLIIVLVGSLLGWQHGIGGTPQPTATPSLDPQTQAYVTLLHTYYEPVFVAVAQDTTCEAAYGSAAPSAKQTALQSCRATSAAVVGAAQALDDHLRTSDPPARWQKVNDDLQAAAQATINIYSARVAAIDARSTSQFDALILPTHTVLAQYCGPIALINAGLPASEGFNTPNLIGCSS